MPTELLPCPFCGCDMGDPETCYVEVDGQDGQQVGCRSCDAQGPAALTEEGARVSWNLRAPVTEGDRQP